jgi:predicted AAA+ superfamily ATPase
MLGFPIYVTHNFIDKLVNLNYTIVLIDQVSEPPNPIRKVVGIYSLATHINSNQNIVKDDSDFHIIDNEVWENLLEMLLKIEKLNSIKNFVHNMSIQYNIDKKNIIKDFLNYIIRNHPQHLSSDLLNFIENLMHSQIQNNNIHIYYSLSRLSSFISM